MRLLIICAFMATVLGGCGVSEVRAPQGMDSTAVIATEHAATITAASPTVDQAALLQEAVDHFSNEATIVAATLTALHFDPSADPAVATEASRRNQDNFATYTALQPTLSVLTIPLANPRISDAARAASRAADSVRAGAAVANAASITPVAGQSADEAALMQQATLIAATMIALGSGAPVEPAVATEATRRYQDLSATIEASQPTPQATPEPPPIPPTVEWPTPTPYPTPDLQRVPAAPAPAGLAGITLPATQEEVAALFAAMPPAVAGQNRDATTSILIPSLMQIDYGKSSIPTSSQPAPRITLSVGDWSGDPFKPGWSGAQRIIAEANDEFPDRVQAWGRDGHLYWVRGLAAPPDPQRTMPNEMLLIGTDTSTWVFSLLATSPEELDALAGALVEALPPAH